MPVVKTTLRAFGSALFLLALVALAWLLFPDLWSSFHPSIRHQQAGALALMFVGSSFVCLRLSGHGGWREKIKGVLLGLAFVLWGAEQFLPAGRLVTAVDSAVIAIFVVDLGLSSRST
jgi:hypothetical protein